MKKIKSISKNSSVKELSDLSRKNPAEFEKYLESFIESLENSSIKNSTPDVDIDDLTAYAADGAGNRCTNFVDGSGGYGGDC